MFRTIFARCRYLVVIACLWLAGCASISGPRDVAVPIDRLQSALARKLPVSQRYVELFDVSVTNPRLQLRPETNRMVVTVDAVIAPVFARRRLTGSFTLSGIPAIDAARRAVVLREPRMENLTLDGVDTGTTSQLAKIGDVLAQKILADVPLHSFDPEQFRYGGVQFHPTRISTTEQAIVVTFEPVK